MAMLEDVVYVDGLNLQASRVKFPKKNLIPGLPKVIFNDEKKTGDGGAASRKVEITMQPFWFLVINHENHPCKCRSYHATIPVINHEHHPCKCRSNQATILVINHENHPCKYRNSYAFILLIVVSYHQ
jgi:hypothetical protein